MTVDLIVNPASGPVVGRLPRRERVHAVSHLLRTLGATTIRATETTGRGDATEAVHRALDAGSDRVVVWGGDGTLNEVASQSARHGDATRRGPRWVGQRLRAWTRPAASPARGGARRHARTSRATSTPALVNGRSFLNLAGVGFDAAVADRFNTSNLRRGLVPYVTSILHEWRTVAPQRFRIRLDESVPIEIEADLVVVCNGQQYGHGARVAPEASFDDGVFDVVAVPRITAARIVRHGWRLFSGTLPLVPGVFTGRGRRVEVSQAKPMPIHLDGEVVDAETARTFEVRPRSLRIMTR